MGQWLPLVRIQAAGELGVGGALTFHYNLMHFLNFVSNVTLNMVIQSSFSFRKVLFY